jgi:hypothetical protein
LLLRFGGRQPVPDIGFQCAGATRDRSSAPGYWLDFGFLGWSLTGFCAAARFRACCHVTIAPFTNALRRSELPGKRRLVANWSLGGVFGEGGFKVSSEGIGGVYQAC